MRGLFEMKLLGRISKHVLPEYLSARKLVGHFVSHDKSLHFTSLIKSHFLAGVQISDIKTGCSSAGRGGLRICFRGVEVYEVYEVNVIPVF